jgi:hypothetical protein
MRLSEVQTGTADLPPRIVLLGGEKRGKSTFASRFPSPVFVPVKGETGIDFIDVPKVPAAKTFGDVMEVISDLYTEKHDFRTVVIDSISALDPVVIETAMAEQGVKSASKLGGGYGAQEGVICDYWRTLLGGLDALRTERGIGCILIGHVKPVPKVVNDPMTEPYDTWRVEVRESVLGTLNRWADCILFCDFKKYTRTISGSDGEKKIVHADTVRERCLYTQYAPGHPGGGRGIYGHLPYELPLSYEAFSAAVESVRQPKADAPAQRATKKSPARA